MGLGSERAGLELIIFSLTQGEGHLLTEIQAGTCDTSGDPR